VAEGKKLGMIRELEGNIGKLAGEDVKKRVMAGSELLTEKMDKKKMAKWVKEAMDRLDSLVDEGTRTRIMENCGYMLTSAH